MAELESIDHLIAARNLLKLSLDKSRNLASLLDQTDLRLKQFEHRFPFVDEFRPTDVKRGAFVCHVGFAIGPVAGVLKVFDAVSELEKSILSDPVSDLSSFLLGLKRLEDTLKFLGSNCVLAIQWLEGVIEQMEGKLVGSDRHGLNVEESLIVLRKLQAIKESSNLDNGCLNAAFDRLGAEFRKLCFGCSPLSVYAIQQMQDICERLCANNRLEKCMSIYVEVRCFNARMCLRAFGLDYIETLLLPESDDVEMEDYIDQWSKNLELAVTNLFEPESKLCKQVFEKFGSNNWMDSFGKIVTQSGFLSFLKFGIKITEGNKDPIKLLKSMDIFAALFNLREDFNRVFGGQSCAEIQTLTRDLIKRVVNGACEIFLDLPFQVKMERQTCPPSNGSIPRLVKFVTEYCNHLLGDTYRPILTQILVISHTWKQEKYEENLVLFQIFRILKELALNLDTWSKAYEDITLSYIFMTNNHFHFRNLKGTKLGEMMGDAWLKAHEQNQDYYAALYLKESWAKVLALLSQKGLKAFNKAFGYTIEKQEKWVLADENLRENMCKIVVKNVVPVYEGYLKKYGDGNGHKNVKYSVKSLEMLLSSLFRPNLNVIVPI